MHVARSSVVCEFSESIDMNWTLYSQRDFHSPGLPRKTDEYKRLVASAFRASGGDDHSLRHHRPIRMKRKDKRINVSFSFQIWSFLFQCKRMVINVEPTNKLNFDGNITSAPFSIHAVMHICNFNSNYSHSLISLRYGVWCLCGVVRCNKNARAKNECV